MHGISILLASRRKGNANSDLRSLLDSLNKYTFDHSCIEVVIRFDDDDDISALIDTFHSYPFQIKYLVGSQGKGYFDLCHFYNEILPLSNPNFEMVMCVADDMVVIERNWEQKVFRAARNAGELFILHQWLPNLNLSYKELPTSAHRVDETPIWSRKLLSLTGGIAGVGSTSDVWTVILEWLLRRKYRKSITRYIHRSSSILPIFDRKLCDHDLYRIDTNLLKQRPEPGSLTFKTFDQIDLSSLPEWKHAQLIAKHKMGVWPYWNVFYLFLQKLAGRLKNQRIDFDGISLHAPPKIVYLVETDWYGYNICCCAGLFFAIPQSEGTFDFFRFQAAEYNQTLYTGSSLEEVKRTASQHKLKKNPLLHLKMQVKKWLKLLLLPIR
jgi:hypothetical protein